MTFVRSPDDFALTARPMRDRGFAGLAIPVRDDGQIAEFAKHLDLLREWLMAHA